MRPVSIDDKDEVSMAPPAYSPLLVAWLIGFADTVKVQILCRASLVLRSPLEPKHRCAVTICHPVSWGPPRLILCPSATGLVA
jgi:hypothetical protein